MKKSLLIAAAVLITFGACTNDDSAPGQEITFKSVNQRSSKALFHGPMSATYNENEHFGVFSFYNDGTDTPKTFMNNVEIKKDDEQWRNVNVKYYWPTSGSLTFACYSPYDFIEGSTDDATIVSATKDGGITFTGFIAPTDSLKQIDLMVADAITPETNSGVVTVTFKHILSQIKFTARTKENYKVNTNVSKIVINKVEVHKICIKGDYSSNNGTFEKGNWSLSSIQSDSVDYLVLSESTNPKEISLIGGINDTVHIAKPILIIPQNGTDTNWSSGDADKEDKIFEIKYTVTFKEGSTETETTSEKTAYIKPNSDWEKGKIYTYNLVVGLNEITFNPEVEVWDAGTDTANGGI